MKGQTKFADYAPGSRVASSRRGMLALAGQARYLFATLCRCAGLVDENGRKGNSATMATQCQAMVAALNAY